MRIHTSLVLSISLFATSLVANQPSPRSQIGVYQITQKALTTLAVKAEKTLTLNQLLGAFKLVKRIESASTMQTHQSILGGQRSLDA